MTTTLAENEYGVLAEPATLRIERLLPGPIERVWAYLVESDLRRQWLAAGTMEQVPGAPIEFVWRNDELMADPGHRPESASEESRMTCTVTDIEPPRRLGITWGSTGGVTFTLDDVGDQIRLTVVHHRVEDRSTLLGVSAGWHAHLDVLAAKLRGNEPRRFWDEWARLRDVYDRRFPV